MITGQVNAYREAVIPLRVQGVGGFDREVEAVIDTGFDGFLTLSSSLIQELGLVWRRRGRAMLADGSDILVDIYEATVTWDGKPRRIAVDEADSAPLVGMSLLDGYELTVQVIEGGRVTIRPLPQS